MTVKGLFKLFCEDKRTSISELAKRSEIDYPQMKATLNRNFGMGMTVKKLVDWCNKIGLEITLTDMNDPDNQYVLDGLEDIEYKSR